MCVTNEDVLAAIDDGLKAGSAKSVDGQGRCLLPHAASQGNMARNVCGVDGRTERNNVIKLQNCRAIMRSEEDERKFVDVLSLI